MRRTTLSLLLVIACGCGGSFGPRRAPARAVEPIPEPAVHAGNSSSLRDFLASRSEPGRPADPRIAAGDVIRVDVADVDEASREYTVSPKGKVRMPLIGEVSVAGKSAEEAGVEIAERLDAFVVNPSVQVKLVDVAGDGATIEGAVERPGRIRLGLKGKTLLDALSAAGGLTSDASGVIRITPEASAPPGLFAEQHQAMLDVEPIELAAADLLRADGPAKLYLRPGDRIEVVSQSGAVAAPDLGEELDTLPAEAADVEDEEPALVERALTKPESTSRSNRDRAEGDGPAPEPSEPELGAGDELAAARAEAAEARRRLAAERARADALSSRLAEIEAGQSGATVEETSRASNVPPPARVGAARPPVSARRPAPPRAVASARVSVLGRVQNQGIQSLVDARTVSRAVERAALAPNADASQIEVRRGSGSEEWRISVNLFEVQGGQSPDVLLEDGDTIFVP